MNELRMHPVLRKACAASKRIQRAKRYGSRKVKTSIAHDERVAMPAWASVLWIRKRGYRV